MSKDPVLTNEHLYRVVMENDRVRVLEYRDRPGDRTTPHVHPDSVMITLSSFRRRLYSGDSERDVELREGMALWVPAQRHAGENIGETASHSMFIEFKNATPPPSAPGGALGPQ